MVNFPKFKKSKTTPIYKKDNKELLKNMGQCLLFRYLVKYLKKIIYYRLNNYFTSKGILSDNQFGFRKGHSASHALHHSVDIVKHALKNKERATGIFIDLRKAFETIDHEILLENYIFVE